MRICIATVDVAGPYACGGVGAAFQGLALALARAGHDVTLLYTHDGFRRGTRAEWEAYFAARDVRFVHRPQPPAGPVWYGARKEASFDVWRWLREQPPFDVVHAPEWLGLAYYALVAKRQGLAFGATTFCIGTHGPSRWSREGEERMAALREDLVVDFMERRSVALADVVVSPSRYMLAWMRDDGWALPERSYVVQNLLETPLPGGAHEAEARGGHEAAVQGRRRIDELVFFGRLDRRKGVPFFCDVVDRLQARTELPPAVTFLGSTVHFDGRASDEYIRARAARWRSQPSLVTGASRDDALAYLARPGRLAVMPARADNLPCTVHECVQLGIPFLATDVGGAPELVAAEDRGFALCPPDAEAFAARLAEIVTDGQAAARPACEREDTRRRWLALHDEISSDRAGSGAIRGPAEESEPLVSVCIAHHERPAYLEQMLSSLERQTWGHLEVIVSDDGSRSAEAIEYLDGLPARLAARGWTLLRGPNRGPALARHAAAQRARGRYLLFLDDDDWAEPHAVETMARAALHSGSQVLVSVYRSFEGDDAPRDSTAVRRWFLPLGPALAAALVYPETGGAMILIEREVYFAAGGFPADRDVDEDWELLLTLVSAGYDVDVVPEPLFWYRDQAHSRSRADNRFRRTRSRVRLFERMLPLELRDFASLALVRLSGAEDSESLRRLERVRQVLDRKQRGGGQG